METKKTYVIGESSERLLKVLDLYKLFQDKLLEALELMYGEKQGSELYMEHDKELEDIERIVMEYLRINFTQEMGTGKEVVII